MPVVWANGVQLYYELRGAGVPLLLIMGASGCGGVFDSSPTYSPRGARS